MAMEVEIRLGDAIGVGHVVFDRVARGPMAPRPVALGPPDRRVDRAVDDVDALRTELDRRAKRQSATDMAAAQLKEIEKAVEAGKLTPAEGKAQIDKIKASIGESELKRRVDTELEELSRKIKAAVEAGKLSSAEGKAKLEKFLKERKEKHSKR